MCVCVCVCVCVCACVCGHVGMDLDGCMCVGVSGWSSPLLGEVTNNVLDTADTKFVPNDLHSSISCCLRLGAGVSGINSASHRQTLDSQAFGSSNDPDG